MLDVVEVFLHDILVYMAQKDLVDKICFYLMINSLYSKVFVVYFYFVGKVDSFQYYPVRDMDDLESLLGFVKYLEDSAAFGICEKFVSEFFIISCCCK